MIRTLGTWYWFACIKVLRLLCALGLPALADRWAMRSGLFDALAESHYRRRLVRKSNTERSEVSTPVP